MHIGQATSWGDLAGLLNETATQHPDPNRPLPDTGNLKADLAGWTEEFTTHLARPGNRSLLKAASALAGPEDTNCLKNRRNEATMLVTRAGTWRGHTPTVQQGLDHMIAPIVYRLVFGSGVKPVLA